MRCDRTMLDTVALTLDQPQFEVERPELFSPSAQGLLTRPFYPLGARGNFSCVLNPTRDKLDAGRYMPRLTLTKRKGQVGFALTLRIEFSAPKLLFGNNFDELRSRDFEAVLLALHGSLVERGIRVREEELRGARVSAIHYSKNMAFTDFTTCSMVIGELGLINLNGRLDLSHTDYRNEGHAIRYHANSFEVTFYDKMKDLQKARLSEKRAVERDNGVQLDMLRGGPGFPKELEVLRMEVRLGNRTKIRALLRHIGHEAEPTFAALFDTSLAKEVLLHFWRNVRSELPLVAQVRTRRPEEILAALVVAMDGKGRPGKLLQCLGAAVLVGSVGWRGTGAMMARHCSPRSWQRYKRELKTLDLADWCGFSALRQVDEALTSFEPLRLATYLRAAADGTVAGGKAQRRVRWRRGM